ncbi:methyl-accepting chemotaxis protein [Shewanella sp. VB17]|uniref:methyl-accepting chemotaxis protein n=1 Tax=Shewanella sp. VB17 TaxID=2739432 RepID=UPI001567B4EB|nr:methyl-accepting chemotaxis protein [Shewanella sp. VB17]NRD73611.1 methyl-accepting chemotaxis protein [Shewanella sp. VB17]
MSAFFSIGINIANRLNFKKKFSLLALATLVPLSLGAAYLIQLQYQQVKIVGNELRGLASVNALSAVDLNLQQARLALIRGDAVASTLTRVSEKLVASVETIDDSESMTLLSQISNALQSESNETALDAINHSADLIADLKENIGSSSGLALDHDPKGFYLAELYLTRISAINDYHSRVSTVAIEVLGNNGFTPVNYTQLVALNTRLFELLESSQKTLSRLKTKASSQEISQFIETINALHTRLSQFIQRVDADIISPENVNIGLNEFTAESGAMALLIQEGLNDNQQTLATLLNEREVDQSRIMFWLMLMVISVVIGSLYALLAIYKAIVFNVYQIESVASQVSNGNLSHNIQIDGKDEFSQIALAFNSMLISMRTLIREVQVLSHDVVQASSKMQEITNKVEGTLTEQQTQTHEIASAIGQMVVSVNSVESSTGEATSITSAASHAVEQGQTVISATVSGINSIAEEVAKGSKVINQLASHSSEIGNVVDVIRGIAEQTNLLALNAAIEAARAGEQGRGFAVVADEVRSLASRTQLSTQEIQTMIEQIQLGAKEAVSAMEAGTQQADNGVTQANEVRESISVLTGSVQEIVAVMRDISSAVAEQRHVSTQIDSKTSSIGEGADDALLSAKNASQIGLTLAEDARKLAKQIEGFKL